ncbi:hypothetical protein [Lactococcus cremoris]|jgi:hypothetical protein|uniref:Uncharacterized protein n=1 Tax=Lactococcus lactis subsp. cremoris TaxID=1359 RepID=A0AAX4AAW5_LACLC|nr:hypothetical protein [Lactococcus cremoris]KGH34547.1 hypothetical protein JL36_01460 [Lactococcus cremoris]QSE62545.1 hypothetical protein JWR96_05965 [Lactococcus cremoris]WMX70345.1 hypothetical protein RF668_10650 [Lactococcus cremoris]
MKKITLLTTSILALGIIGTASPAINANADSITYQNTSKNFNANPSPQQNNAIIQEGKITFDRVSPEFWEEVAPSDYQYITADGLDSEGYLTRDTTIVRLLVNENIDPQRLNMEVITGSEAVALTGDDAGASEIPGLKYVTFDASGLPMTKDFRVWFNISELPGNGGYSHTFAATTIH